MTNINKTIAEILVEQGHAKECYLSPLQGWVIKHQGLDLAWPVDPYLDDNESRKQLEAVEDYLHNNEILLVKERKKLEKNQPKYRPKQPYNGRQKRIDRIKWCIEHLEHTPGGKDSE